MGERWGRQLDPVTEEQIRAELKMGHDIWDKMLAMGMESPPAVIMAHLPEIYTMRRELQELTGRFLSADVKDKDGIGDALVGIKEKVLWHAGEMLNAIARERALERVISFCGATPRASAVPARRLGRGRAQKRAKMAQSITDKLLALGRRRPSTVLGERLSDLYVALEDNERLVDRFLRGDVKDLKAIGKVLVDLKVALDVILYRVRKAKAPLDDLIAFCLPADEDES